MSLALGPSRRCLVALAAVGILSWGLGGCGSTDPNVSTPASSSQDASYPISITSQVPPGVTQMRVTGDDIHGDPVVTVTVDAARTVSVQVPQEVRTLLLEYLDATGHVRAVYSESHNNMHDEDFRRGITDPSLVEMADPTSVNAQARKNFQATAAVTGPTVRYSFAFFGCNRAKQAAGFDGRENFSNQLDAAEKASTANVAQLRQHFLDAASLQPAPKFIFLCGDAVNKVSAPANPDSSKDLPTDEAMRSATARLKNEMVNWRLIRKHGESIVDHDGTVKDVPPAAPGSLFEYSITAVVMPGNHEMCHKIDDDPNGPPVGANGKRPYDYEYPNKYAGEAFSEAFSEVIRGSNGPTDATTYEPDPLSLFDSDVARDESKLSYTFQDGDAFFMVVNTDTYVGDSKWDGRTGDFRIRRIPLRWIREKLRAAQLDPSVRHIFVFGHRPIRSIGSEAGIDDRQAETFYKLLNNPLANSSRELDSDSNPPTKVRGYFCAHAHLLSTLQPSRPRAVKQIVAGSGGSEPDSYLTDEGFTGARTNNPFPWFGFATVAVRDLGDGRDEVDLAWFGRNVHTDKTTTKGKWWEQEPLKLRRPNIQGPGDAQPKTPKALLNLYSEPVASPAP